MSTIRDLSNDQLATIANLRHIFSLLTTCINVSDAIDINTLNAEGLKEAKQDIARAKLAIKNELERFSIVQKGNSQ